MHISEGVLSSPVLLTGAAFAAAGLWIGLKKMRTDQIAATGVMAAAFFVASLIHVPVGVTSAHLLLVGLTGVLLGWPAIPAIFTALVLQAFLFQYGGITTLGVNTACMGYAAVAAWYIFHWLQRFLPAKWGLPFAAFCAGSLGVAISGLLTATSLAFTNEGFVAAAIALLLAHLPIMLAEGFLTMLAAGFLARIRPESLGLANSQPKEQIS